MTVFTLPKDLQLLKVVVYDFAGCSVARAVLLLRSNIRSSCLVHNVYPCHLETLTTSETKFALQISLSNLTFIIVDAIARVGGRLRARQISPSARP